MFDDATKKGSVIIQGLEEVQVRYEPNALFAGVPTFLFTDALFCILI